MLGKFGNVLLCEDVREEIGNKKTLVGVYSGDVVVKHFPATLRVAFYAEYMPMALNESQTLNFGLEIGGVNAVHGKVDIPPNSQHVAVVLPQGIAHFDAPGDLVLKFGTKLDSSDSIEILRKKIMPQSDIDS